MKYILPEEIRLALQIGDWKEYLLSCKRHNIPPTQYPKYLQNTWGCALNLAKGTLKVPLESSTPDLMFLDSVNIEQLSSICIEKDTSTFDLSGLDKANIPNLVSLQLTSKNCNGLALTDFRSDSLEKLILDSSLDGLTQLNINNLKYLSLHSQNHKDLSFINNSRMPALKTLHLKSILNGTLNVHRLLNLTDLNITYIPYGEDIIINKSWELMKNLESLQLLRRNISVHGEVHLKNLKTIAVGIKDIDSLDRLIMPNLEHLTVYSRYDTVQNIYLKYHKKNLSIKHITDFSLDLPRRS